MFKAPLVPVVTTALHRNSLFQTKLPRKALPARNQSMIVPSTSDLIRIANQEELLLSPEEIVAALLNFFVLPGAKHKADAYLVCLIISAYLPPKLNPLLKSVAMQQQTRDSIDFGIIPDAYCTLQIGDDNDKESCDDAIESQLGRSKPPSRVPTPISL